MPGKVNWDKKNLGELDMSKRLAQKWHFWTKSFHVVTEWPTVPQCPGSSRNCEYVSHIHINRIFIGSYRPGMCTTSSQVNSALHPSGVAKSSTSFSWGKGGKVTTAGWQVTLCDPIWHMISRSGVVISITNCYIRLTYSLLNVLPIPQEPHLLSALAEPVSQNEEIKTWSLQSSE